MKERESDGKLLSFETFELLRGVFNKELDSHARNWVGRQRAPGLESCSFPAASAPLIPVLSTSWARILSVNY